jgi:predicted transcriptional regulator
MALSDSDVMYLLTLLRSSEQPMSTEQLVQALKERTRS